MHGFQLGREFKISIAEILTVFPEGKIELVNKHLLIINGLKEEEILKKAKNIGGTIKIIKIEKENDFKNFILKKAENNRGKFNYGISVFGIDSNLKKTLNETKRYLSGKNISSRFVNKNFENISSAQIIPEKLIENKSDFTILREKKSSYIGYTIWTQNIEEYSKRDYSKSRDMKIGMLPPKLSQMMINLSGGKTIYDPFVGLGTILIESLAMGNKEVYGSDFNPDMIEASNKNISNFSNTKTKIFLFDARDMEKNTIFSNNIDSIVTEGFLGEIMTKKNINLERINIQRKNLSKMYEKFFYGLKKKNFRGNIVITFPFWEIDKKYYYFIEIYDILNKYCNIIPLFPNSFTNSYGKEFHSTKSGSLLYKRKNQLVGRELFKLTIL
ncbi:hypothetical protein CSA08_03145 [Candidatus Gracilibacteria bacterium]|nr:MAG: hypothetical protein CSA08_03145 [Candidatus Gracilibacteria bacterium]